MTYPKIFAQPPGETSHCYALFLDGSRSRPAFRVASWAPRQDGAASGGLGRPCRRGRAADLCGGHGGRGRWVRPWPRKGFRVSRCFGSGLKVFTGFVFLMIFSLVPHLSLNLRLPLWNKFSQRSCQIFSLPVVECSDFIFVAGMYPEFEKKEKKWKTHGILQRTAVRH